MNRITRLTAALLVSAAAASPALAAPQTYVVDSTHTFPSFSYSHFGFSTQLSRFNKTSGKIVLDREAKKTPAVRDGHGMHVERPRGR